MIENMHSRNFDEWQQLDTFIKIYTKSHREKKLCIIGSLGPDFNTLNETTRIELKKMTDVILKWLTDLLAKGKELNVFAFEEEPRSRALHIFSTLVASLQLARIVDSMDYKVIQQSIIQGLKP